MAVSFNPGAFRHNIAFLRLAVGDDGKPEKDAYGENTDEWEVFKKAKASCAPILGKELYTALTADTKVEVKFKTRYIRGVSNEMRIEYDGELYEIISAVDVDCMNKELLCYCKRVKR